MSDLLEIFAIILRWWMTTFKCLIVSHGNWWWRSSHGEVSLQHQPSQPQMTVQSKLQMWLVYLHWRLLYEFWSINSLLWSFIKRNYSGILNSLLYFIKLICIRYIKLSPQPVLYKLFHVGVWLILVFVVEHCEPSKLLVARKQRKFSIAADDHNCSPVKDKIV